MAFTIKADNPNGLDFEHRVEKKSAPGETSDAVRAIVRRIVFLGGENVTINGTPVPEELIRTA